MGIKGWAMAQRDREKGTAWMINPHLPVAQSGRCPDGAAVPPKPNLFTPDHCHTNALCAVTAPCCPSTDIPCVLLHVSTNLLLHL